MDTSLLDSQERQFFSIPFLVKSKDKRKTGIHIDDSLYTFNNFQFVRKHISSRNVVEIINVAEQNIITIQLEEFLGWMESTTNSPSTRNELWNLLSLKFHF